MQLISQTTRAFRLFIGRPGQLPPRALGYGERVGPLERSMLEQALACSVVGSPETVRHGLEEFIRETRADELMVKSQIFDQEARLRSFEMTAAARQALPSEPTIVKR